MNILGENQGPLIICTLLILHIQIEMGTYIEASIELYPNQLVKIGIGDYVTVALIEAK